MINHKNKIKKTDVKIATILLKIKEKNVTHVHIKIK